MKRDSVVFYGSWKKAIDRLGDGQRGAIYEMILDYAMDGKEPDTDDPVALMIFELVRVQIEVNNQRYENGKKGGRPKQNQTETKTKPKHNQKQNKAKANVNVNGNDNKNIYINTVKRPETLASEFEELWKLYPRKQGRAQAMKSYFKARKEGTSIDEVRNGIIAYADYIKRNDVSHEYIKQGSTFFNQHAWSDDWSANYTRGRSKFNNTNERNYDMDSLELKLLATN